MFAQMISFPAARKMFVSGVAALAALGASQSAQAGMTELRSTPYATEQNQSQIFAHTYGGSFSAVGDNFTNGAVTATRVDDLHDVLWSGNHVTLSAVASFAGSSESLGLVHGATGDSYESLFTVDHSGYQSSSPTTVSLNGSDWRFTLDNSSTNLRTTSLTSDNGSGDQMITYKITGLGDGKAHYMLFWEDAPLPISDHDYNDLVVSATFDKGGPTAIPLPPAALTGLATLGGIGMLGYWKRRKGLRMA